MRLCLWVEALHGYNFWAVNVRLKNILTSNIRFSRFKCGAKVSGSNFRRAIDEKILRRIEKKDDSGEL